MKNLVLDLTYNVENLVDMREMIVNKMESDRALMVRMFLKVGQKEINFIWHISALIGFALHFADGDFLVCAATLDSAIFCRDLGGC